MNPKTLLVVEDHEDAVVLLKGALKKADFNYPTHFVRSGEEALTYVFGRDDAPPNPSSRIPHVMLLDLNLPGISGFDVLKAVKASPDHRKTAVIIYSTSFLPEDVDRAYRLSVNAYIAKPASIAALRQFAEHLKGFWFGMNLGPSPGFEVSQEYALWLERHGTVQ